MNTITIYIHIIVGGDRGAMQYGVLPRSRTMCVTFEENFLTTVKHLLY